MTVRVLARLCATCGLPVERGDFLSWRHSVNQATGPRPWRSHNARPRQSVEPSTARPSAPSSGRGQVDGSTDSRERITGTAAGT